jgi:hypothetical protein
MKYFSAKTLLRLHFRRARSLLRSAVRIAVALHPSAAGPCPHHAPSSFSPRSHSAPPSFLPCRLWSTAETTAVARRAFPTTDAFIANRGQWDSNALFAVRTGTVTTWATADGMRISLTPSGTDRAAAVFVTFEGEATRPMGDTLLPGASTSCSATTRTHG